MQSSRTFLSYDDISRLLSISRSFTDARHAALITIILVFGATRTAVTALRWSGFDPRHLKLRFSGSNEAGPADKTITELLARQILAIPRAGSKIFVRNNEPAAALNTLLSQVLSRAALDNYCWEDLIAWSNSQPAQVLASIGKITR